MMRNEFSEELGFMHEIKQEVDRANMPYVLWSTLWDYKNLGGINYLFFPLKQVYHITDVIHYMSRVYDCQFRILLIIDDLDRCRQDRIMGVLSAVTLLLEPNLGQISPYISVLAIDPRVLLGAIEKHFDPENRGNCNHANVNGWVECEYIIHWNIGGAEGEKASPAGSISVLSGWNLPEQWRRLYVCTILMFIEVPPLQNSPIQSVYHHSIAVIKDEKRMPWKFAKVMTLYIQIRIPEEGHPPAVLLTWAKASDQTGNDQSYDTHWQTQRWRRYAFLQTLVVWTLLLSVMNAYS